MTTPPSFVPASPVSLSGWFAASAAQSVSAAASSGTTCSASRGIGRTGYCTKTISSNGTFLTASAICTSVSGLVRLCSA